MNMGSVLEYIQAAGAILSAVETVTEETVALVNRVKTVMDKGVPDAADWDALHATEAANTAAIDAPMAGEATGTGDNGDGTDNG